MHFSESARTRIHTGCPGNEIMMWDHGTASWTRNNKSPIHQFSTIFWASGISPMEKVFSADWRVHSFACCLHSAGGAPLVCTNWLLACCGPVPVHGSEIGDPCNTLHLSWGLIKHIHRTALLTSYSYLNCQCNICRPLNI